MILCPYCLCNTPANENCKACNQPIPRSYTLGFSWHQPPVVFSAVGFRGHGKTVYLAAMLHELENYLTRVWTGFYRQALDQATINNVKNNLKLLEQGDLPLPTPRNFPSPSLHLLARMPKFKDRQFIIYDSPGEAFEEDLAMEQFASFVTHAKTVLFLISLVNLDQPLSVEIHRLLEVYTLGMTRMKAKLRDQHLIVVYTKADLLLGERFFGPHPDVVEYLQQSRPAEIKDIKRYLAGMLQISNELESFTFNDLHAENFMNLAKAHFKSISFCATSALGSPPENHKLSEVMQPRRVIDPLLWVLSKT